MDKFFDRLGDILKDFLDDDDRSLFGNSRQSPIRDPDLDEAYEELDEFLRTGKNTGPRSRHSWSGESNRYHRSTTDSGAYSQSTSSVPEVLRKDFEELGLPFGASEEECKAAYKRLLKVHHPDRHAGHPANMKKATEKSARINAAYQRIETWRQTGKIE
ncbi:MAG: J domain-containing protein [Termitinemataceae bacterium]